MLQLDRCLTKEINTRIEIVLRSRRRWSRRYFQRQEESKGSDDGQTWGVVVFNAMNGTAMRSSNQKTVGG